MCRSSPGEEERKWNSSTGEPQGKGAKEWERMFGDRGPKLRGWMLAAGQGGAKDEAARINGFFRICLELPSSFSSMAVVAAMQGNTKKPDPIFAEKLVKCPLFKDWRKKNVSTLNNKYIF